MMLKLKFRKYLAIQDAMNSSLETIIFDPKEMLGILDLTLMGYYKINMTYYSKIWTNTIHSNLQTLYMTNLINS